MTAVFNNDIIGETNFLKFYILLLQNHKPPQNTSELGYVHTGSVPSGSDLIQERTISVHTAPFRLSTSGHTGLVCYCSVLDQSKKRSCFYQLSMRTIHVKAFKMALKKAKSIEEGLIKLSAVPTMNYPFS